MNQELRHAEREAFDRRGQVVTAGQLARRSAEQAQRGSARQPQPSRLAEVEDARLGDRAGRTDGGLRPGRAGGQTSPRGCPQRQVAARGVTDDHHAREVERRLQPAEAVDPGGHVLERGGPATPAAPAEPPVLEVPDGPAARREIRDERVLQAKVVPGPPVAAVDQDGDRPGRLAPFGPRQLPELVPPPAVGMPQWLDAEEYREPLIGSLG